MRLFFFFRVSFLIQSYVTLTLSTLVKIFSRQHIEIFFLIFPRKQDLTFHAVETIYMKYLILFSGKKKKITILLFAELAKRVIKVKAELAAN